jgi:HAD superfamily hydrolase (TIGR01549 family)
LIALVTFDAAGTLLDHSWDPENLLLAAVAESGLRPQAPVESGRFAAILKERESDRIRSEASGDTAGIRSYWQGSIETWLLKSGLDPSHGGRLYEYCLARTLQPNGEIWRLHADAIEAIRLVRATGARLGVISNWDHTLHQILANLGLENAFDFVIASLEFGVEKPDRRIFDEAIRRGDSVPGTSLHVGDDDHDDIFGATQAGWRALRIDRARPTDLGRRRISSLVEVAEQVRA